MIKKLFNEIFTIKVKSYYIAFGNGMSYRQDASRVVINGNMAILYFNGNIVGVYNGFILLYETKD